MAKSGIQEKITTTHKLDIDCILNVDNLIEDMILGDIEDQGEVDLVDLIKKFNGEPVKISITKKTEEVPEEV